MAWFGVPAVDKEEEGGDRSDEAKGESDQAGAVEMVDLGVASADFSSPDKDKEHKGITLVEVCEQHTWIRMYLSFLTLVPPERYPVAAMFGKLSMAMSSTLRRPVRASSICWSARCAMATARLGLTV